VVDLASPATCWPVDTSLCTGYDALPADRRALAEALAGQTLRMLTGYRMGGCPVVLRPSASCWQPGASTFSPIMRGGQWFNDGCGCSEPSEIRLPVETGRIVEVRVGGVALDPSAYRLVGATRLLRVDGEPWPRHQDLAADPSEPDTFSVEYVPGLPVDGLGAQAAGRLACEYATAAAGKPCALPRNATSVARQGVSVDLTLDAFPDGRTGIREVDLYVQRWNPNRLASPSSVWSPGTVGPSDGRGMFLPVRGPAGPQGVRGPAGPSGGGEGGADAVLWTQSIPAATWIIPNPYGRLADVQVYLPNGEQIDPDITATEDVVTVVFPDPTAGSAVLN